MAAKPKKPATSSGKATAARTTVVAAASSTSSSTTAPSSSIPSSNQNHRHISNSSNQSKDELGPAGAMRIVSGDPDHRSSQPFQGAAPLRQVQQSPNLNNGQSHQPSYAVQGVFSPQAGLQSPYLNNPPQFQPQHTPSDNPYYTSNPSPRSTHSTTYYPPEKAESMAAATATMQRPYPPIYHTPQSNSPASVTSPQTHDHGRPMFPGQPTQLGQQMYGYSNYSLQSAYGAPHQQPPMNSQPMPIYQSNQHSMTPSHMPTQQSGIQHSPRMKNEASQYSSNQSSQPSVLQRYANSTANTGSNLQPGQQSGHISTSNAAPGPIPATTPLVVRQDGNGVQWISFEYSRDRVKMEYQIRCDVESVDSNSLTQEFKSENCVYPRACVPKEQYKGNRLAYETDCNQVGWALAQLNTCLRGKRGLIQRAVDSWRNSNQDPRLRSRRVRRQAKLNTRSKVATANSQTPGPAGPSPSGLPGSNAMAAPSARPSGSMTAGTQSLHHHHAQHDVSPTGQDQVGASPYSTTPNLQRSGSSSQQLASPHELRQAHAFPGYQPYPAPTTMGPSMAPPIQSMHQYGRPGGNSTMSSQERHEKQQEDAELFGDVPEGKRRKFILVEDTQKNARVRVKATLDQIQMSEIPDSYRKSNSVYPRAYYPVQMQSTGDSTVGDRFAEDDMDDLDDAPPTVGKMTVPCSMTDGEGEVEVAQLSKGKRSRERRLNELGYRMAWGQSRVFAGRPIFLARALDAYRYKQHKALEDAGQDPSSIPSHLETRPGKRRWRELLRPGSRAASPPATSSD